MGLPRLSGEVEEVVEEAEGWGGCLGRHFRLPGERNRGWFGRGVIRVVMRREGVGFEVETFIQNRHTFCRLDFGFLGFLGGLEELIWVFPPTKKNPQKKPKETRFLFPKTLRSPKMVHTWFT